MKIYIICPVRSGTPDCILKYVQQMEGAGHLVYFPPRDTNQGDPVGLQICKDHREAIIWADEIHVFWDINSKGSHFDLGMAWSLHKKIIPIMNFDKDIAEKSYWKVINSD